GVPATKAELERFARKDEALVVSSSAGKIVAGPEELVTVADSRPHGSGVVASGVLGSQDLAWARASIDADRAIVVVSRVRDTLGQDLLVVMGVILVIIIFWAALSSVFFGSAIASAVER